MKVKINNKETNITAQRLDQFAEELALPDKGVAVAVNNRMVTRADWAATMINEGDDIVVIKAVCGG